MSKTSVGIICKQHFEPAKAEAEKLEQWLSDRGVTAFSVEMSAKGVVTGCLEDPTMVIPEDVAFFIVLGGTEPCSGRPVRLPGTGRPFLA